MTNKSKPGINCIWKIFSRVCLVLMLVQILPGLVWLVKNIGHLPRFHETGLYLKAAENLIIDEYMGILYPLLIRMTKGVAGLTGIPYYVFLYVLQVLVAFGVGLQLLRRMQQMKRMKVSARKASRFNADHGKIDKNRAYKLRGKAVVAVGSLYLLTVPMLLQMHLAILPYSLALSVAVLLVAEGVTCFCSGRYDSENSYESEAGSAHTLIRICGLWLLGYLLLPEYGILLGVFVGGVFLNIAKQSGAVRNRDKTVQDKNRQNENAQNEKPQDKALRGRLAMAFLFTVLCFGVIAQSTQTSGGLGRMQRSAGSVMVNRFVWPHFVNYSFYWDERVNDTFSYNDLVRFSQSPEAVMYEFGPVLEEKYGKKEANDIYWNMATTSIKLGTKQALAGVGRDFFAYLCPQVALQQQLRDNDSSLSGWNYGRMQEYAPVLTKYYVKSALAGWNFLCLMGIVLLLAKGIGEWRRRRMAACTMDEKDRGRSDVGCQLGFGCKSVVVYFVLLTAVWYTMSGGMQDYKKAMIMVFLWALFAVKSALFYIR